MTKFKLHKIIWKDHVASDSWWSSSELDDLKLLEVTSVGYEIIETDEAVTLASTISENNNYKNLIVIAKSCIVKQEILGSEG